MKTWTYKGKAQTYADLEIENTLTLLYFALPDLLRKNTNGKLVLDYGSGAGRSTQFLKREGFDVIGVDMDADMLKAAHERDPNGEYHKIAGNKTPFPNDHFDAIISTLVFMEFNDLGDMTGALNEMRRVLKPGGVVLVAVISEQGYQNEFCSFFYDFPKTGELRSGSPITCHLKGTDMTLEDYYWTDADYKKAAADAGLSVIDLVQPLARGDEKFDWVSETTVPPWSIYVLGK